MVVGGIFCPEAIGWSRKWVGKAEEAWRVGVKGSVPNGRQTGAFKAGAELKLPANRDSPWAEREERG